MIENTAPTLMIPAQGAFTRWYLQHRGQPTLAWTGASWARHNNGIGAQNVQICNFNSQAEAETYIAQLKNMLRTLTHPVYIL